MHRITGEMHRITGEMHRINRKNALDSQERRQPYNFSTLQSSNILNTISSQKSQKAQNENAEIQKCNISHGMHR
jgi:hypothetical protein